MSTTVQFDKSAQATLAREHKIPLWLLAVFLVALALGITWWALSPRKFIIETVHPYRVTHINLGDKTMYLVHGNRSYVVRCQEHCGDFKPAGTYPMYDAGAALEYMRAGRKIIFPIIEEETTFDLTGGHG
ncbi:MAG TPA: hypothetical protein VF011_00040 [Terriglobales bacterium]